MKRLSLQKLVLPAMFLLAGAITLRAQENTRQYEWNAPKHRFAGHSDPCKVFIGVGTSSVPGGLKVDYTVDDTPASISGVQAGDVILSLDGVPVRTHAELIAERDKHRQGEAFTLQILRGGSEMNVNARFKACSEEEQEQYRQKKEETRLEMETMLEEMKQWKPGIFWENEPSMLQRETTERPILGVYEDNSVSKPGLVIERVIPGKGAEEAGLQAGDVVTTVDGKPVTGGGTLRTALAGRRPGDRVAVVYERDGQIRQTELTLSAERAVVYQQKTERDPCAVFIGVYTASTHDERGVQVTGVVDDTPAKQSNVQPGDVILALDGQPVNSTGALLAERDKHQPGDNFRLTIDRDGTTFTIDATFKACPTPAKEKMKTATEQKRTKVRTDGPVDVDNALQLESLQVFPNPTAGPLNVRFEAEAVPTTVRIFDASGKAVYSKGLNQFNGSFNEQINLFGNTPGTFILSVQQGNKTLTRKVVLVPGV